MLVIRKEQMAAFEAVAFESWMCAHVREHFPSVWDESTPGEIEALVHQGVQSAASYGFSSQAHVAQFIDVMLLVGEDFDSQLPWAAEILDYDAPPDLRIQQLVRQAELQVFGD